MGAKTRRREIRRRRHRKWERRKRRLRELRQALGRGRTRQDRLRIAQELRAKAAPGG